MCIRRSGAAAEQGKNIYTKYENAHQNKIDVAIWSTGVEEVYCDFERDLQKKNKRKVDDKTLYFSLRLYHNTNMAGRVCVYKMIHTLFCAR